MKAIITILSCFLSIQAIAQKIDDQPPKTASQKSQVFDPNTTLWFKTPAAQWEDALPVGNGRLGAMIFGGIEEERIQLNEDTYWTGGPYSTVVKDGYKALPEIQKLIFEGKPIEAHRLFGRKLMGYPVEQQKYQSLANLHLFFDKTKEQKNYRRSLDLGTGLAITSYEQEGITFSREVFASAVDQNIAIRLSASEHGQISFAAELRGVRNSSHSNYATDYFRMDVEDHELVLKGKSADYLGIEGKLRFEARLRVEAQGGTITQKGTQLVIKDADEVIMYFVAATNFINYKDVSADEEQRVQSHLRALDKKQYESIKQDAIKDHHRLFGRVQLNLPITENAFLPTDERMIAMQKNPDPSLAVLYYQFGRYLLIASSRPGTQPTNLQGIWNKDMNPSWDAKYTTNINTQMNYWAVESANLSELAEPLFTMIEELTDQGSQVAKEHYGADGWVFHQNTDLWRVAAPMDGPTWGTFTVGGAWLVTHMWEHYLYSHDEEFLQRMYPTLKGSVDFFMDFLVMHPNGKWLVTNPSNSPENPPKGPGYEYFYDEVTGMYYFTTITAGATMDMQILKDLFGYYIMACQLLQKDLSYAAEVSQARAKLVPSQVGKDGSLQEWAEDLAQLEDKHRHFSHMYGLYPGNVLSVNKTPHLVNPIKSVLEQRGDGGTGFSRAWKMALWARLYDGNRAYKIFKGYVKEQSYMSLFAKCFTPLQVDGSLGLTAAITEMLIQSHEDVIHFLPALPTPWEEGTFKGVKARGGYEIDFAWQQGKLTSVNLQATIDRTCKIKTQARLKPFCDNQPIPYQLEQDGTMVFKTTAGKLYKLR